MLVVVAIDATTFNDFRDAGMKSQFPFPRRYYARVLDHLHQRRASVPPSARCSRCGGEAVNKYKYVLIPHGTGKRLRR